jgi:hypothetical protein
MQTDNFLTPCFLIPFTMFFNPSDIAVVASTGRQFERKNKKYNIGFSSRTKSTNANRITGQLSMRLQCYGEKFRSLFEVGSNEELRNDDLLKSFLVPSATATLSCPAIASSTEAGLSTSPTNGSTDPASSTGIFASSRTKARTFNPENNNKEMGTVSKED